MWDSSGPDGHQNIAPNFSDRTLELSDHRLGAKGERPIDLKSVQLHKASLRFAQFSSVSLEGADLTGAALQHACLCEANLEGANLRGARLDYADLSAANLKEARLRGASLRLASLESASLQGADLREADLLHTRLKDANLRGADLSCARLDHADFAGSDLAGANLRGASLHHAKNLTRAQLKVARKSHSTILPLHLQQKPSSSARISADERPTAALVRKAPVLGNFPFSDRHVFSPGAAIAALIIVGVALQEIGVSRLATLDFSNADEVSELPVVEISTNESRPTAALWPLQILPETMREAKLSLPQLIADAGPPAVIRPAAVGLKIEPSPDTLRSVSKVPILTVRETPKVPNNAIEGTSISAIASYYGKRFAGRPTASGETFNPRAMTAAHRSLPFGTRVLVTHSSNGRSVIVRINDRGPFIRGRSIDLSAGAAAVIGMDGIARVHLTVIK